MKNNLTSDFLSQVYSHSDHSVVVMIYLTIVFLFGIPGNCLILGVYWSKTHKTSTHVLIWTLAMSDVMICSFGCLEQIFIVTDVDQIWVVVMWYLKNVAFNTSMLTTAAVACDRFDCVCRSQRRFFTFRRAIISALMSLAFAIMNNIPSIAVNVVPAPHLTYVAVLYYISHIVCFAVTVTVISVCYGKVYATIRNHVRVGVTPGGTSLRLEPPLSKGVLCSVGTDEPIQIPGIRTISTLQPSSSSAPITASTSHDAGHLCNGGTKGQSAGAGNEHSTNQNKCAKMDKKRNDLQHKTTLMLFATSVLFLLTYLPAMISFILTAVELCISGVVDPHVHLILDVGMIVYINNAINPLIYGVANRRFRKDCAEILHKIKLNKLMQQIDYYWKLRQRKEVLLRFHVQNQWGRR